MTFVTRVISRRIFSAVFIFAAFYGWSRDADAVSPDTRIDSPLPLDTEHWVKRGVVLGNGLDGIQNFNSTVEPLDGGRWRIWYGSWRPIPNFGFAEGVPGGEMKRYDAVLSEGEPVDAPLSIGNLPDGWRPVQPVSIKLKDGRSRLYFWVHSSAQRIVRFLVADSVDGRRYRVLDPYHPVLYHFNDRAVEFEGTTAMGLKLQGKSEESRKRFPRPNQEPAANPDLICNDGVSVYQLDDGSFEMYAMTLVSLDPGDPRLESQQNDNLKGYRRAIDRLISDDGIRWHSRRRVIEPDAKDPDDLQFYYLTVTYTPEGRVGLLGRYRLYSQETDLEWCYSRDGITWTRPERKAWLSRGEPYAHDSYAIYPANSIVRHDNSWWLFYTGTNYAHNLKCSYGQPRSVVMLAQADSLWKIKMK